MMRGEMAGGLGEFETIGDRKDLYTAKRVKEFLSDREGKCQM